MGPGNPAALETVGVSFDYGTKRALTDVSFAIAAGEIVFVLGPNGAGKTTLFSLICGLFRPTTGRILISGKELRSAGASAIAPLGIVFQSQTLDLDLTVGQNLRYFCALRGMSGVEAGRRIADGLERLAMRERIDEKVRALNGGHRRRVEIARAMLHNPAILLLDEPTTGLDIPTRRELIADLHARAREGGTALLWATHLIDEAAEDDRVVVLNGGRVVGSGRPAELCLRTGAANLNGAFSVLTRERAAA